MKKIAAIALAVAFVWPGAFLVTIGTIFGALWLLGLTDVPNAVGWLLFFVAAALATTAACIVYQKVNEVP